MSTAGIIQINLEDEYKTFDKKQIEEEEKERMLKAENVNVDDSEDKKMEGEGTVRAALAGDVTEQGREVKPKYIPIGAIKMPGFFTRNSDKDKTKDDESTIEKDTEHEKTLEKTDEDISTKPQIGIFQAFAKLLQSKDNDRENDQPKRLGIFNVKYPKMFQKKKASQEAALASMETLEEKLDTNNDGMENINLDAAGLEEGKVATINNLSLMERFRQKKFNFMDKFICTLGLLMLLGAVLGAIVVVRASPPVVRPLRLGRYITTLTSCGPVEGIYDEGVYKFYGIPYAVPPVGERRFTYAQPLDNLALCWNGTLQLHEPSPLCLQMLDNSTIAGDEDCLTLDVVTPRVQYRSPVPVVVLVGANTLAGGLSPAQPSALYARTKEVVFVRPNFRLGPFGFLALDILSNSKYPPTSGNYGLSDLLVVLQWIQYNIKHFGGDAESVTLLGHRAGATLVAALTTVTNAQKLYSRAWLSSPSVIFPGEPLQQSQSNNEQFKQLSKCNDAACLRRITATEILAATPDTWLGTDIDTLPSADEFRRSWLVQDGNYLRVHAYENWDKQKKKATEGGMTFKRIVFGTTIHSGHTDLLKMKHMNWTEEIVEKIVNDSYIGEKNLTEAVFQHFNKTYEGLVELISAIRTLCPLVSLARLRLAAPMYVVTSAGAGGCPAGGGLAAADADVRAILGTFESATPEQRRYMAAMQQYFYFFVWTGRLTEPGNALVALGQDLLKLPGTPACDLLIREDLVPRYAHVD